jgi:hypothetical protein
MNTSSNASCSQVSCPYEGEYELTQEDIDKGAPVNACQCPVARAIKRKHGGYVAVTHLTIHIGGWCKATPPEIKRIIIAFDRGRKIQPQKFIL